MTDVRLHVIAVIDAPCGLSNDALAARSDGILEPLVRTLERSGASLCLRIDGNLLEFLDQHRGALADRVARLASSGQVELLGGGFYAPILALLPTRDAIGQLEMTAGFLDRRTGVRPRGAWLDGGVWEPQLAEVLADAGALWTVLDEAALRAAAVDGVPSGWYATEHAARPLAIFPVDRDLVRWFARGAFGAAVEAMATRARSRDQDDGPLVLTWAGPAHLLAAADATLGLQALLDALERGNRVAADVGGASPVTIRLALPTESMETTSSGGRVYLASGVAATLLHQTVAPWRLQGWRQRRAQLIESGDDAATVDDWLRGGLWQAFLARYGEVDRMHKRMVDVSRRFAAVERVMRNGGFRAMSQLVKPRRALYRGQAGAAYGWGEHAGLHDAGLRAAVHAALAEAERSVEGLVREPAEFLEVSLRDLFADFDTAVLVRNRGMRAVFSPARGGVLATFELTDVGVALHDVMTRRLEDGHPPGTPVDGHDRGWLHDRFLLPDAPTEAWMDDRAEVGDLMHRRYRTLAVQSSGRGADERVAVTLACDGALALPLADGTTARVDVALIKRLRMRADTRALEVDWSIEFTPALPVAVDFGVECNIAFGSADPAAGRLRWAGGEVDGSAQAQAAAISTLHVHLAALERPVSLRLDRQVALRAAPITTLAQPAGVAAQIAFQGVAALLVQPLVAGTRVASLQLVIDAA